MSEDFFATRTYTDEALRMVEQSADSDQPFFAYLAYTAPHDPLHVEDPSLIEKYSEVYTQDYNFETLRTQRIERLADIGLLNEDVETRWPEQTPHWETLTAAQRDDLASRMAVYAAVIHETDQQIGRVVDYLKETGEYDNTLIVLASDNGASAANHTVYTLVSPEEGWHQENYPSLGDVELYGRQGSFTTLALPNAQVSSGPYFQAKNTLMEGGTRVPAIMKAPSGDGNYDHQITDAFAHMTDLYPTFVEYAGADLATSENLLGSSAKPLLEGNSDVIGDGEFGWEHLGQRAYRSGEWKLSFVPKPLGGTGSYALYNLAADPGETNDLKDEQPELLEELAEKWDKYATDNGVVAADFDQVNEVAPRMAAVPYAIDWAAEVSQQRGAHNE